MAAKDRIFVHFANLLSYPEKSRLAHIEAQQEALEAEPALREKVADFASYVMQTEITAIEEQFTNTFDLGAAYTLEIGWHLFGEDYRRGEFLVNMRQSLAEENLPESIELPDHISHCLELLARLDWEDAKAFANAYLQPAMKKILTGFPDENPYRCVVEVLQEILLDRYGIA
ncbi:MAG: nitrate reductase molybdenum cofactor assembly chaperone, partial [bacterium]